MIWDQSFGGSNDDVAFTMAETAEGDFLVGGESGSASGANKTSPGYGNGDFWLLRLGQGGNKIWDKSYGGSGRDTLSALVVVSEGGCVVGGSSGSGITGNKTTSGRGGSDFWIMRLDAQGNRVWEKSFGGTGAENLWTLQPTADGGFIGGGDSDSRVSGDKTSPGYGETDFWVVRLDAQGTKLWDRSFGGGGFDTLLAIRVLPDGTFLLGGGSDSPPSGNKTSPNFGQADFWIVRVDAQGEKLWDQSFGGTGYDELYNLSLWPDGAVFAGGISDSDSDGSKATASLGGFDFWLFRLRPDFVQLRTLSQPNPDFRQMGYRFLLQATSNLTCVTEFTTNFTSWSILQTNKLGGTPAEIHDPSASSSPRRHYRARLLP
jgi:hypothetical protein